MEKVYKKAYRMEELDKIQVDLPESVKDPKPRFSNTSDAIRFYSKQLEIIASKKSMSLDEMKKAANAYEFGPEESFEILALFDSISALKSIS